jgi:hypothetical protein
MRNTVLFILLGLCSVTVFAQETLEPPERLEPSKGVIYNKETVFDFFMHTSGFGVGMKFGEIKTYYRTKYYHIEFGNIKHPKEFKPSNPGNYLNILNKPYVYGKQNGFYTLRAGIGEKRYFSEKARERGIAVALNYQGGLSLGFLKPYYLDLRQDASSGGPPVQAEKYSEENEEKFLDRNFIVGYSGFSKGLGETKIIPGIHLKGGVHFAWGAYDQFAKALEVGVMLDLYFQTIDIMIIEDNKPYFINLYLNLQLGKRK